ncbi:STAS/SEC14 domain-containing protein [Deferribacter abyssi]|uniref:STAS/SEC14 domain-containing protein n=1 Tax=Deferribacter abyssi TaxID=213806 RepID=UPI003C292ED6
MERLEILSHKGKIIIYLNFSEATPMEAYKLIEDGKKAIRTMQKNSVYTLVNVKNLNGGKDLQMALKDFAEHNKPYVKCGAVVGVTGWRKAVYSLILKLSGRKNLKLFDTIQEAKDWLSTQ